MKRTLMAVTVASLFGVGTVSDVEVDAVSVAVCVVLPVKGNVAGGDGGLVTTISGGQEGLLFQKVTSARCTQRELLESTNSKISTCVSFLGVFAGSKQIRTSESQETVEGLGLASAIIDSP